MKKTRRKNENTGGKTADFLRHSDSRLKEMQKNLVAYLEKHPEADSCDAIVSLFWFRYLRNALRAGFGPAHPDGCPAFKAGAFGHSANAA